jgi:hypothetical protein
VFRMRTHKKYKSISTYKRLSPHQAVKRRLRVL